MKRLILIPALMSLMAAGANAQENVIDQIHIDTDAYIWEGNTFYISDIDSITFYKGPYSFGIPGQTYKLMRLHGNGANRRLPAFPVDEIRNIEFKFRDSRKLPSPKFTNGTTDNKWNNLRIVWEPVNGAKGYVVRYCDNMADWEDDDYWATTESSSTSKGEIKLSADLTTVVIENLNYSSQYTFGIKALSDIDDSFDSDWTSRNCLALNRRFTLVTGERYKVPTILSVASRDTTSLRIAFDLDYANHASEDIDKDFASNFEIADGKFVAHELNVTPLSGEVNNKWAKYMLTTEDMENGYVDIDGLSSGTTYKVSIRNNNVKSEPDATYNNLLVTTKAPSQPKLITHVVTPGMEAYNACNISTELAGFMADNIHDSQVFYLEGGKIYYINSNVDIIKGFTLETLPSDVAAGKHAVVYMCDPTVNPLVSTSTYNFMLGGPSNSSGALTISPIALRNIDFQCPSANNIGKVHMDGVNITGNYFINSYSNSPQFTLEALQIENCTFQGIIRGFIRMQGSKGGVIQSLNCDGNIFYNCGYFDANGRGYGWFCAPGDSSYNMFGDFHFTNNTIYDSPLDCLLTDGNKIIDWPEDYKWNITIENNTFINFSTRTSGRYFLYLRYVPNGSHFSIQRNLFCQTKNEDDARQLYFSGADIRSGEFTFEIKDNYSVGCQESNLGDDKIFTSGAFSAAKNSFGAFPASNKGTATDLVVSAGSNPLKATDLFNNPNPPHNQVDGVNHQDVHKAPDNIFEALRYKQSPEVTNHEIYTKNIGDQRWKN